MKALGIVSILVLCGWAVAAPPAAAQSCSNRGQLDEAYCDADGDLVADIPAKTRDPSVIVFAYTPVEDPAVYENAFRPFTEYLGKCTGKRVVYYPVQSNSAEIEAMRSGRLTVAGFSTGPVGFAVNMAGAVPFAAKGTEKGVEGYNLIVHRQGVEPVSEAQRSQGQEARAYLAVLELGQSGAEGAVSRARPEARRGLSDRVLRRPRQIGARRRFRRL